MLHTRLCDLLGIERAAEIVRRVVTEAEGVLRIPRGVTPAVSVFRIV